MGLTRIKIGALAGCVMAVFFCTAALSFSQGVQGRRGSAPNSPDIELTKEFYDALLKSNSAGKTVYTNDPSLEYLQQIAVSMRFLVETNLEMLAQQKRTNRLLTSLLEKQK